MFVDELAPAFRDQSIGKIAYGMYTPTDAITCLKHGDLPACAMEIIRSGKPGQAGTDDNGCFILIWDGIHSPIISNGSRTMDDRPSSAIRRLWSGFVMYFRKRAQSFCRDLRSNIT